jgi:ABC-type antimicrobial peptide transport system permease subunit
MIACINFMNLSTAKATRRLREVGVKKVIGAEKKTLILQFLTESFFMTLLSLITAVIIVILLLPSFNQITGKHLSLVFNRYVLFAVLIIGTVTGIISGSYPAFYLSGFKPITVQKASLKVQQANCGHEKD